MRLMTTVPPLLPPPLLSLSPFLSPHLRAPALVGGGGTGPVVSLPPPFPLRLSSFASSPLAVLISSSHSSQSPARAQSVLPSFIKGEKEYTIIRGACHKFDLWVNHHLAHLRSPSLKIPRLRVGGTIPESHRSLSSSWSRMIYGQAMSISIRCIPMPSFHLGRNRVY